ncbi:hypothetical protein CHS0354_002295 [Potamilus streckersoni]|uniref:Uncharacterized protein n=1 Tax=Potamilus streckersoni TaxID=2493646 RepID=A0AAE0SN34_9BIVA|nr:hypothetical protein CHS0354_002295 [Potamilus streckersoni]
MQEHNQLIDLMVASYSTKVSGRLQPLHHTGLIQLRSLSFAHVFSDKSGKHRCTGINKMLEVFEDAALRPPGVIRAHFLPAPSPDFRDSSVYMTALHTLSRYINRHLGKRSHFQAFELHQYHTCPQGDSQARLDIRTCFKFILIKHIK